MNGGRLILILLILFTKFSLHAQSIGIGTINPHASSILEVSSSNKGVLIPRVSLATDSDVITISSPALFLFVFNTNTMLPDGQGLYFWNGNKWMKMPTMSNLNNRTWGVNGNSGTTDTSFIGTIDNHQRIKKK
jgi:hypothetical protein